MTLLEKQVFAHVIKDLEMRSSWIKWVGPKSNVKCPCKRLREETDGEEKAM